jgi:hypothetical protein
MGDCQAIQFAKGFFRVRQLGQVPDVDLLQRGQTSAQDSQADVGGPFAFFGRGFDLFAGAADDSFAFDYELFGPEFAGVHQFRSGFDQVVQSLFSVVNSFTHDASHSSGNIVKSAHTRSFTKKQQTSVGIGKMIPINRLYVKPINISTVLPNKGLYFIIWEHLKIL